MLQPMPGKHAPLSDRFWAKVQVGGLDDCWLWGANTNNHGYGMIRAGGSKSKVLAHRVSYEIAKGPIPLGLFICHRCDNPKCVNPAHLFIGTAKDNVADMCSKGRKPRPKNPTGDESWSRNHPEKLARGERSGHAKLTDAIVREIKLLQGTETSASIGRRLGVDRHAALKIWSGKSWAHVK